MCEFGYVQKTEDVNGSKDNDVEIESERLRTFLALPIFAEPENTVEQSAPIQHDADLLLQLKCSILKP